MQGLDKDTVDLLLRSTEQLTVRGLSLYAWIYHQPQTRLLSLGFLWNSAGGGGGNGSPGSLCPTILGEEQLLGTSSLGSREGARRIRERREQVMSLVLDTHYDSLVYLVLFISLGVTECWQKQFFRHLCSPRNCPWKPESQCGCNIDGPPFFGCCRELLLRIFLWLPMNISRISRTHYSSEINFWLYWVMPCSLLQPFWLPGTTEVSCYWNQMGWSSLSAL